MSSEQRVLVTGCAGFIGKYIVRELIDQGYGVVGIDNFSKYGEVELDFPADSFEFIRADCKDPDSLNRALHGVDYMIMGAAMIGGISYFHKHAYDLLAENERISAASFDAAIKAYKGGSGKLKRVVAISSSMVFEGSDIFPSVENDINRIPSPMSTYGFQKLAVEYFCKGAFEQYGLPYTIVRPFNCVGIGEGKALTESVVKSGELELTMAHVLPDLIYKVLKKQYPVHILGDGNQIRHYTHGKDLARGIVLAMAHESALCEDFNLSTSESTTVKQLLELIWDRSGEGSLRPLKIINDPAFTYDVQKRIPSVEKARELLGFEASIGLTEAVDEVIMWCKQNYEAVADET